MLRTFLLLRTSLRCPGSALAIPQAQRGMLRAAGPLLRQSRRQQTGGWAVEASRVGSDVSGRTGENSTLRFFHLRSADVLNVLITPLCRQAQDYRSSQVELSLALSASTARVGLALLTYHLLQILSSRQGALFSRGFNVTCTLPCPIFLSQKGSLYSPRVISQPHQETEIKIIPQHKSERSCFLNWDFQHQAKITFNSR